MDDADSTTTGLVGSMTVDLVTAKHRPTLFAIALIDASIIGASAVSLAIGYALGNVLSLKHSLYRGAGDARGFYLVYCG